MGPRILSRCEIARRSALTSQSGWRRNGAGGSEIDLEEVVIPGDSALAGTALGELGAHHVHVSVVAIKRDHSPLVLNPAADVALGAGDRVIVVGDRENVTRLAELVARPR